MRLLTLALACAAFAPLSIPLRAQGSFRDPQDLGFKPLDPAAIESSVGFDKYSFVYGSDRNPLAQNKDKRPVWTDAPEYTSYGDDKSLTGDLTKEGVKHSVLRLRARIRSSTAFNSNDDNSKLLLAALLSKLDEYLAQLDLLKPFVYIPRPEADFEAVGKGNDRITTEACYFCGSDRQIVLGGDLVKKPPTGSPSVYYATVTQAIEIRAVVDRMRTIFVALKEKPYERVTARLTDIDASWSNYLEKGYSQYPWESLLNSYVTPFTWESPPHHQFVFLHPELGFEIDTRAAKGSSAQAALMVHTVGYVAYPSDARDWFVGGSATLTFSDQDFGLGIGPTLHVGWAKTYSVLPHISVGAYWHDFSSGSHGPIIGFSLDFWRLLNKDNGSDLFKSALGAFN